MSATTTAPRPGPGDAAGQVLVEAARRMVPVLAGRLLAALADQAVERVERLAERLDDRREHGPAPRGGDGDAPPARGAVPALLAEQVRTALAIVVRLVARAAEMLRAATERLRARRAPEAIDVEAEQLDEDERVPA